MRSLRITITALLLSCGTALAQSSTSTLGMGTTSPLRIPGSSASTTSSRLSDPVVGLGATEIDPGGLSPAISPNCNSGTSRYASSPFDGGGMAAAGPSNFAAGGCMPALGSASSGSASSLATSGTSIASSLSGGIPLGATELNGAGVSPMIFVQTPSRNGCTGGPTTTMTAASSGSDAGSSLGC